MASSTLKEMNTRLVYHYNMQRWVPYVSDPKAWYRHLLYLRDGYGEHDSQGRYRKKQKEIQPHSVVNLVTAVAQALEMAKLEIKMETRGERMTGGERKKCKATVDWKSFRYWRMNTKQLQDMLLGYPVAICAGDHL